MCTNSIIKDLKIIDIELLGSLQIQTRPVLFIDPKDIIINKNKKPFITINETQFKIRLNNNETLNLLVPKLYPFDGATILFGIGKGNMKLLIPALIHDIICENKNLVNYNRKLSSMIFKECLIKCKVNWLIAEIMFICVDVYQKYLCDWNYKN